MAVFTSDSVFKVSCFHERCQWSTDPLIFMTFCISFVQSHLQDNCVIACDHWSINQICNFSFFCKKIISLNMAIVKHIYCLLGSLGSWHKCFSPNPNLISRVSAMSGVVTSNTHSLSLPTPLLFHPLLHLMISNLSHFHRFSARFLLLFYCFSEN